MRLQGIAVVFARSRSSLPCLKDDLSYPAPDTTWKTALELAKASLADGIFKPTLDESGISLEILRTLRLTGPVYRTSSSPGYGPVVRAPDIPAPASDLVERNVSGHR